MDLLNLYGRLPSALQSLALSIYGARLRRVRYGGAFGQYRALLERQQWLSRGAIQELQSAEFRRIARWAVSTVPFYEAIRLPDDAAPLDEWIGAFPILTKADVKAAGDSLISRAVKRESLEKIGTGGTTGTPLTIFADRNALRRNYAFFERTKSWAGVEGKVRTVTFAGRLIALGSSKPPYWRYNLAAQTLLISSYHISPKNIPAIYEKLLSFKPQLIDSYPSSLEPIAKWILSSGQRPVGVPAIITSSETLVPSSRDLIERAFGSRVYDQYGSAEMVTHLAQCSAGRYHESPEFGLLELVDEDGHGVKPGESGAVVGTGFINMAMPLIRYSLGDWITPFQEDQCDCGRRSRTFLSIAGRCDDVVILKDGTRVGRLDPIFKGNLAVAECRLVQESYSALRVEYVSDEELSAANRSTLERELRGRVGEEMQIRFVRCAELARTSRGKLRGVVREF